MLPRSGPRVHAAHARWATHARSHTELALSWFTPRSYIQHQLLHTHTHTHACARARAPMPNATTNDTQTREQPRACDAMDGRTPTYAGHSNERSSRGGGECSSLATPVGVHHCCSTLARARAHTHMHMHMLLLHMHMHPLTCTRPRSTTQRHTTPTSSSKSSLMSSSASSQPALRVHERNVAQTRSGAS